MVRFPADSLAEIDVWVRLLERFSRVRGSAACTTYQEGSLLGFPGTVPLSIAHDAFEYVMRFNPNNIQMHAKLVTMEEEEGPTSQDKERGAFHVYNELEREAIAMMVDLMGGEPGKFSGYIASGGTEANIYALWVARNRLLHECGLTERDLSRIVVVTPLSSHYSIQKAANLLGLTATDEHGREAGGIRYVDLTDDYAIDLGDAERAIDELRRSPDVSGVIASVTCGSTTTGAYDDVRGVGDLLTKLGKPFHLHVDAAFGGLVVPFLVEQVHEHGFIRSMYGDGFQLPIFDFRVAQVDSMTVDPHKMGMAPYPAGVVLLRGDTYEHIARRVEYIADERDETLIGSRPAASAAACWAAFMHMGKDGYERVLRKCMKLTDHLVRQLTSEVDGIEIVGRPFTNYFSFRFVEPVLSKLTPELLKSWDVRIKRFCPVRSLCFRTRKELGDMLRLEASIPPEEKEFSPTLERYRVYRVAMMPHVSEDTVARFSDSVRAFVEHVLR